MPNYYGKDVKCDEDGLLLCPCCGSFNLHHVETKSIYRSSEDNDGISTICCSNKVLSEPIEGKQIETRRDVTYIKFYCEHCCIDEKDGQMIFEPRHILKIVQHKGVTLMAWEKKK